MKNATGITLIAAPFIAIFTYVAITTGIIDAIITFGLISTVVFTIGMGIWFLMK